MGIAEDIPGSVEIEAPEYCPSCGSKLIRDGVHYFCENTLGCKPQLVKNIVHFAERKAMNIEGLSDKTIEQLMDANIINTVIDIYKLKDRKNEVLKLERFGEKKFQNLIESIEKSKKCKLSSLIYALGINGIGEKTAKDICKVFNSIDKLYNCDRIDLLNIEDVGNFTADSIHQWFNDKKNIELLHELLTYITIEEDKPKTIQPDNQIFSNRKIYCTGTFASYKKDQLKAIVENLGGEFAGGYLKSLDYLVVGSLKGSSKVQKAEKDGVRILSEDEFLGMIK